MLADQMIDAQVLNDEGVHADVGQGRDRLYQLGQLILPNQGVDGTKMRRRGWRLWA